MKKISTRQLIIFYCIYFFSVKFLTLPRLLASGAGTDAWIVATIGVIAELLLLFIAITVLKKRKDNKAGGKIITILMLAIFAVQLFILTDITYTLITQNLFPEMHRQNFIVPLVLFGAMLCFLSTTAIFRSGEIFYLLIILGVILSVLPAIPQMQPSLATPMLGNGFRPILRTVFESSIFFESTAFLLIFCGDISITRDFRKKFMTTAIAVAVTFVFFVFMTTTLFGALMPYKSTAIADMTMHSSVGLEGTTNWILVCIWLLLLALRFGITFFATFVCIRYLFNIKEKAHPNLIGAIAFTIATILWATWTFANNPTMTFIDSTPAVITVAILVVLIPLTCFISSFTLKPRGAYGK